MVKTKLIIACIILLFANNIGIPFRFYTEKTSLNNINFIY